MAPCPANVQELLTFLPERPELHPQAINLTSTAAYTALDPPPPAFRFISSQVHPGLIGNLKEFIGGVVNAHGLGGLSCQPMQPALDVMASIALFGERDVSVYGIYVAQALNPVVKIITTAAGIADPIIVKRDYVHDIPCSQIGNTSLVVMQQNSAESDGESWVSIQICSDQDEAYSVLLSEAEALCGPFSLDATKKQTGAKAMVVKLALQMATSGAEFGLFFAGSLAIVARLVTSTDPTCPGLNLHLSPVFKLQNEALPLPTEVTKLTPFQANIQAEPFLAVLAAMLCAKLVPGHSVKSPPLFLPIPPRLEPLQDADNAEEDNDEVSGSRGGTSEGGGEPSGVPPCYVQVATNAMVMQHPWSDCSDIHRISVIDHPLSNVQNTFIQRNPAPPVESSSLSPMQPRKLLRAPHIPSMTVDTVTLVERIQTSKWSSIYTCHLEDDKKPRIMKLVSELHSAMVLRELYMYEVALKGCSFVPRFYGTFQRPAGGWFAFLLENVGENLEEAYGSEWSDVKSGVSAVEWEKLTDSVQELHSLGVMHGDLEPRNVAQANGQFKFFDFGRSEMHQCQGDECWELKDLLGV